MRMIESGVDQFIESRDWGESTIAAIQWFPLKRSLALVIDDVSEHLQQALGNFRMERQYLTRLVFFRFTDVRNMAWEECPQGFRQLEQPWVEPGSGRSERFWDFTCKREGDQFELSLNFLPRGGFFSFQCKSATIQEQEIFSRQIGEHFELFDDYEEGNPIDQEALLKSFLASSDIDQMNHIGL